jgi:CO dehydrogenase maturation factor
VLALDSDLVPGLALSLGADEPPEPPLVVAAERPEGEPWRLRRGVGPVRAVQRYATAAPDGVRLLQAGKTPPAGLAPIMPAVQAFYRVIHGIGDAPALREWAFVGDLPAGPRQAAFDWAPYADTFLLVVEPTWKSALTARRIARIAAARPGVEVLPVVSKATARADERRVEELLGTPVFGVLPADEAVVAAERAGRAPLDHAPSTPAVAAVEALLDRLLARTLSP